MKQKTNQQIKIMNIAKALLLLNFLLLIAAIGVMVFSKAGRI